MNAQVLSIWSMALGAVAAVALARFADAVLRPSQSQWQAVAYHLIVFLLVLILSGLAGAWLPQVPAAGMRAAEVLAGPLCIGVSNAWIRGWLGAAHRDRMMSVALRSSALVAPLAGLACFALPPGYRLPAAAGISLLGGVLTLWLTVRAWLMGDRLAAVMAIGCLLTLPAIAGLYAVAMDLTGIALGLHAPLAACAALCNGLTGYALWRRELQEWRVRREANASSQLDPVTQLPGGAGLVQQLLTAQRRRSRTRRDGALLAVLVFDVDRIAVQVGTSGVNDFYVCMAGRIQRQVGAVNAVGRYYDQCFISIVETIQSPASLRTLGLRVATSLRRPVRLRTLTGNPIDVTADIGVGVVHLDRKPAAVEDILDQAQRMAQAARAMRSRAAILDPVTGQVMPVEHAMLGTRRHRQGRFVPHTL